MVYIPYDVFRRIYRINSMRKKRAIEPDEILIKWYELLEYYPRNNRDWMRLDQEYGSALDYNWTIWTPLGRRPAPAIKRKWIK